MKKIITNPFGNISLKDTSHKAAWAFLWSNQLSTKDDPVIVSNTYNDANAAFFDFGMEFKGSLNLFGGVNKQTTDKLLELVEFKGIPFSLDNEMPMIGTLLSGRIGNKSTDPRITQSLCDKLDEISKNVRSLYQMDLMSERLCFGCSHSFSAYKPKFMCDRNDGLTLNGALNRGFNSYIDKYGDLKELTVYIGNIDIRHHLLRYGKPNEVVSDLMRRYEKELLTLKVPSIELVNVLPIEDESRKLPKTGYYKGTPFYGSRKDRRECVRIFNEKLSEIAEAYGFSVYKWPEEWYNEDLNFFEYMEKPQSVHLARKYYRWNLENNKENSNLINTNNIFFE